MPWKPYGTSSKQGKSSFLCKDEASKKLLVTCTQLHKAPHNTLVSMLAETVKNLQGKKPLKSAKQANPKIVQQLRTLKYYSPPGFPMKGGQLLSTLKQVMKAVEKALGSRASFTIPHGLQVV